MYPSLQTMIKLLLDLLFSSGFPSSAPDQDEDFFDEPSTMKPQLTAAAAVAAKDGPTDDLTPDHLFYMVSEASYSAPVVAGGLAGARIHYAAPSA